MPRFRHAPKLPQKGVSAAALKRYGCDNRHGASAMMRQTRRRKIDAALATEPILKPKRCPRPAGAAGTNTALRR